MHAGTWDVYKVALTSIPQAHIDVYTALVKLFQEDDHCIFFSKERLSAQQSFACLENMSLNSGC